MVPLCFIWNFSSNLRDCWQITFVMLNRFCPLSNCSQSPVLDKQYWNAQNTNQNQMKNTCPFHKSYCIYFRFWRCILQKFVRATRSFVFISFYVSRNHFSQIFRTSFNIICKKRFWHKFSFNGFTQSLPTPLTPNDQNPLRVTKVFYWCPPK